VTPYPLDNPLLSTIGVVSKHRSLRGNAAIPDARCCTVVSTFYIINTIHCFTALRSNMSPVPEPVEGRCYILAVSSFLCSSKEKKQKKRTLKQRSLRLNRIRGRRVRSIFLCCILFLLKKNFNVIELQYNETTPGNKFSSDGQTS